MHAPPPAAIDSTALAARRLAVIDRLVARAAREIQPLATVTPIDVRRERDRLVGEWLAGRHSAPRWRYAPRDHDELRCALDAAERRLAHSLDSALERLYLGKIRELSLEAAICASAGTRDIGPLARERFAPEAKGVSAIASALCARWLDECDRPSPPGRLTASDDPHPESLLSQMRQAVGRLRLPFAVLPTPALASLAATGERVILIATGRSLSPEDTARVVIHEIEGHALPRTRSIEAHSVLFSAGTARGVDHQEGRALLIEERAGLLGRRRRRHLAARHRAVEAMLDGASFPDVAKALVNTHGIEPSEAVVVAERAFRGGDGQCPGLGRERVYLESFIQVRAHLEASPDDEQVLASGQVALSAIEALRPLTPAPQERR